MTRAPKVCEDVGTTKRKPLTPTGPGAIRARARNLLHLRQEKIVGKFIDEHKRALGLGGSNDPDNRGVAHPKCAEVKTHEDMPRINKAKAQKKAQHGIKPVDSKPIVSPPSRL